MIDCMVSLKCIHKVYVNLFQIYLTLYGYKFIMCFDKSAKRHCGRHTKFWIFYYKITCLKSNYLGVVHLNVLNIRINIIDQV